ncbi:MAG: 3-deoxy-D-manno-octulosonic acid transferase [Alphaproteobacteria bacterium]|nr:3-deoxy-D-manno-octulosonic acid transferase [Alphaproteobacteria bacterium]
MTVFFLYRTATVLGAPGVRLYLRWRLRRGKEDQARLPERLGVASIPRPDGPLIWVHAASVGESLSILPLVSRLREEPSAPRVLVTTGTVTSATLMAARLPEGALHQFSPVDLPSAAMRFLDHWRPDLALWVESEFWPNLLAEMRRRGLPAVLVNARLSDRSLRGWRRLGGLAAELLSGFRLALAQSEEMADRLRSLGGRNVACVGNLKYAADPLPVVADALARLKDAIGGRPCWLAASVHPGEERVTGQVHRRLQGCHPGLLTLLVPRHPTLGAKMAADLRAEGLNVARRAAGEALEAGTDLYLADTLGELGLFYRLAPIAFVGGSLVPHGGQNLLEPARLDCAILHGPHVENFARIAEAMGGAEAALQVATAEALASAVDSLLQDPERGRRMAASARHVAEGEAGVLDRILERLRPFLESLGGRSREGGHA